MKRRGFLAWIGGLLGLGVAGHNAAAAPPADCEIMACWTVGGVESRRIWRVHGKFRDVIDAMLEVSQDQELLSCWYEHSPGAERNGAVYRYENEAAVDLVFKRLTARYLVREYMGGGHEAKKQSSGY